MNTKDDDQKSRDNRDPRTMAPKGEPFDGEAVPSKEASDLRETSEGGYGWGV